jgi:hypothetical protein
MSSKTCTKCGIKKPLLEFHKQADGKLGRRGDCAECSCIQKKKLHAKDPLKARNANLKRYYGITLDDYLEILEAQNGRCAICGTDTPSGKGVFHVDHCHNSGQVRGLLCHSCNVGLGHFKDQESLLLKATLYLRNHHDNSAPSHKPDANGHRPSPRCFPGYCKS